MTEAAGRVGNVLIVGAVLAFFFAPQSLVQRWKSERDEARERAELIHNLWDSIAGGSVLRSAASSQPARVLVEFGQYRCPYCRTAHDTILAVVEAFPEVQYEFRHYPSAGDTLSQLAARASLCADSLGYFTEMHEHLLRLETWHDGLDWALAATRAGVPDARRLKECMDRPEVLDRLRKDMRIGALLGLDGTPAFVWYDGLRVGIGDLIGVVRSAASPAR